MKPRNFVFCSALLITSSALLSTQAADQFWNDTSPNNIWNLINANWDSGSSGSTVTVPTSLAPVRPWNSAITSQLTL
ncbi:MAG: hypothetical protein PHO37_01345 [Kiritimatiellae bacterium]|nr:hypothetical protein [Kiritimatiellia bacterium]